MAVIVRSSLASGTGMVQIEGSADDDLPVRRYPQRTRRMAASVAVGTLVYLLFLVDRPRLAEVGHHDQRHRPGDRARSSPRSRCSSRGLTSTGRLRTCWLLLGCAALSWGIGQVIWTWYEVVLDQEVPYPSFADVGYLGAVPFLLAGVLLFPSRSLRTMGRVRAVIDGLMTLFTVAFVSYGTFLGVVYTTSEGDVFERVLAVVYPAADVLTVAVVLAVLAAARRSTGRSAAGRGGRCDEPRGGRQRVRVHDGQGHLRRRPGHRPRLAPWLRAAGGGGHHVR